MKCIICKKDLKGDAVRQYLGYYSCYDRKNNIGFHSDCLITCKLKRLKKV